MLRLLKAATGKVKRRSPRDARVRREHGEEEARRLVKAGLKYFGLPASELSALASELSAFKKGDERKLAIAAMIRRRTSMANAWLTATSELGHVSRVSQALRRAATQKLAVKLERALLQ
ncbi:MAG: hypothetical protein EOP84_09810 [Verrucomicrobiaceae bacterium]|nr:MAG: hypothetical protein EOP84_09810 [Verrucomicrobiaceae bacterium]